MVQSEPHVIYRLMAGGGQADMDELTEIDFCKWKLTMVDSKKGAASQLLGRGPTNVDASAPARKSIIP